MILTTQENVKSNFDGGRLILERRLDYAKFLLTQSSVPLASIAAQCGWGNARDFVIVFLQCVGVTPQRYRRWHQC